MSIIEVIISEETKANQHKYRLLAYLFCLIISLGYLFEIIFSKIPLLVFYLDSLNILISTVIAISFHFRKIQIGLVFRIQVLGVLVNMLLSHFINPVDSIDFSGKFLRNAISLGMLIPLYGLFSGKNYIFQILVVYLFIYASTLIRVHNIFLIQNAPFLLLNGTIYVIAIYYILDVLGKMQFRQIELNNRLKQQKEQLIVRNEDLNQSNKQINQQSWELKELVATKDKLFSIIAHDLKSPFNTMLGFSDLLIANDKDTDIEDAKHYILAINSTAKHTLVLLENLLAWSYTQTGQIDFKPEELKLEPAIHEMIEILQMSASIKNISLNLSIPNDLVVYADTNMLMTVLRNLVSNAVKFTPKGGHVGISAVLYDKQTEITVADNGIGMDAKAQSDLFNINTTITTKGTANEYGSGLGLILCKEFVDKHGGKIWVDSQPGTGSKFIFTLPFPDL